MKRFKLNYEITENYETMESYTRYFDNFEDVMTEAQLLLGKAAYVPSELKRQFSLLVMDTETYDTVWNLVSESYDLKILAVLAE